MATENKPRGFSQKKKLGVLAAGGIVVVLIVVLSITFSTPTPSSPGAFTLSSNAGSPDPDGAFTLSWTAASGATSYSVYEHTSFITELIEDLNFQGTTTILAKALAGMYAGMHYFVVVARNADGTKLSNCLAVSVSWHAWTWMAGNNAADQPGTYGTKGVPSAANLPGARENGITWVDASGDFWLFGGNGYNDSTSQGLLNDLWRFDSTSFEWTWINGSKGLDQFGTYGTKGEADPANTPGARQGGVSWEGSDGNLWLFGGSGYNDSQLGGLNDMWRFNTTSFEWTWVNGSSWTEQYGTYGTMGTANPANTPGARTDCMSWVDTSGGLWLFGGYGYAASDAGGLNDLWRFNATSFEWTWVNGSNVANQFGTYGTMGTANLANTPGGRFQSVTWVDTSGGLWLFGGTGFGESGGDGPLNDLWRFNLTSLEWTWVNGSNVANQLGTYGTKGIASGANTPGGRYGSVAWIDGSGYLWLFGGLGFNSTGPYGNLNDLWRFDTTSFEWMWVSGSIMGNLNGVYGTPGVISGTTCPGARYYAQSWVGADGYLWLFGGNGLAASGGGELNDLWRFLP